MYKLVLFFSVGLQLASFFMLVSAALWIAKIVHGSYALFAEHRTLYLVAFAIVLAVRSQVLGFYATVLSNCLLYRLKSPGSSWYVVIISFLLDCI